MSETPLTDDPADDDRPFKIEVAERVKRLIDYYEGCPRTSR